MFQNILLALHGRESDKVIDCALELAGNLDAEITVLHVLDTDLAHYGYVDQLVSSIAKEQFVEYIFTQANENESQICRKFAARVEGTGLRYHFKTREGNPADEIMKEIKEGNYDLLVLGTKPKTRGNIPKKVKEKMIKNIIIPVLVLK